MKSVYKKGFTLIELLIVIAVIGVLVAIVILAINPLEQLARGRDANRKTVVAQLGRAMASYVVSQNATTYPAVSTFQAFLSTAGEIGRIQTVTATSTVCNVGQEGNICYSQTAGPPANAIIWTLLESLSETDKSDGTSGGGTCTASNNTFGAVVWVAQYGRAGLVCLSSTPTTFPGFTPTLN